MAPSTIKVEIKRQSNPDAPAVTEKFEVPYRPGMNITSLLGEIALNPVDVAGKPTTPVTYDSNCLEEDRKSTRLNSSHRIASPAPSAWRSAPSSTTPLAS